MCRNIKTLRAPYAVGVTDEDVRAAALQYVRTVGGFRLPAPRDVDAFNQAVDAIIAATQNLLVHLEASPAGPGDPFAPAGPGDPFAPASPGEGIALTRNSWRHA